MALIKMPKKIGGSGASFVDKPGKYHCVVLSVDESPTSKKGQLLNGFQVMLSVMHGAETGKQIEVMFFNPNETDSEKSQDWAMKKQAAFVIATGLATERDLAGEGDDVKEVNIDLQQAKNRQILIEMDFDSREAKEGERKFLQLKFANIFHVDDPRVAKWEKNAEAIKILPATMRRDPKSFDLERMGGKVESGSEKQAAATSTTSGATTTVDLDDL